MILEFVVMGELVKFSVNDDREFLMSGKNTNHQWIPFRSIARESKQDGEVARMTEKIIRSLPTMEDVEWYIKYELAKMGLAHVRTDYERDQ